MTSILDSELKIHPNLKRHYKCWNLEEFYPTLAEVVNRSGYISCGYILPSGFRARVLTYISI